MSECTQEQLNCEKHYFKQKIGADISCTHCGVHIVDLVDGLYKDRAELSGKTGELEHENAELRKQIEALKNCDNCTKPCMHSPIETELTVLERRDDCKKSGLGKWKWEGGAVI